MRRLGSHIVRPIVPLVFAAAFLAVAAPVFAQGQPAPLGKCEKSRFGPKNNGPIELEDGGKSGRISGEVIFECDGTWIFADEIKWDEHWAYANGKLLVIQDGLRVNADRAELNRDTKMGTFFNAYGTARITDKEPERQMFGTNEPQMMFEGEKLERIGPNTYRLTKGKFTTCMQPEPRWEFSSGSATIELDDHVSMKNTAMRVKGVPVFFLPYMYYPIEKNNRSTGFLIPVYSSSGVNGQGISNAFFWAIDPSQDATFNFDYFTKSGQGAGGEYRYVASPTASGRTEFYMRNEKERLAPDGSIERFAHRSYEIKGNINQDLPHRFKLQGIVNYFTDITAQQLYQQNILEQSRRDRNLWFQLTGDVGPGRLLNLKLTAQRRDIFNGGTVARRGTLPQLDFWTSSKSLASLFRSPSATPGNGPLEKVYFDVRGQTSYLEQRPDLNQPSLDRSLWRFDAQSSVSAPLSSKPYLRASGSAYWRITNWQETLDPVTHLPVPIPLTRNLFNLHADVTGPTLEKAFSTPNLAYATKFKHQIEPRISIDWLSPFDELGRVIQIDQGVDSLVGRTTTISYGINNRVYAKTRANGDTREFLSVRIGQSWYSNPQAGAIDPNFPTPTVSTFSAASFAIGSQPTDDMGVSFQLYIDPTAKAIQQYNASTRLTPNHGEHLELTLGWSKRQYLPTVPSYNNPALASHFINGEARYRISGGKYGGVYHFNYDIRNTGFLQQGIQGYYSTQCCGFAVDYQMMNISQYQLQGVGRDRRIAVTFTLGGISSFKTPLGAFGR